MPIYIIYILSVTCTCYDQFVLHDPDIPTFIYGTLLLLPLYRGPLSTQCKQREWAHSRAEVHLLLEVSLLAMVFHPPLLIYFPQ